MQATGHGRRLQRRSDEDDDHAARVAGGGAAAREAQNGRQAEGHRGPGADHPGEHPTFIGFPGF